MKLEYAKEVMACLPKGRTLFHYSKNDYAFLLLKYISEKENDIYKLKKSHVKKLLEKPSVKTFLSQCSQGKLNSTEIPQRQYLNEGKIYRLSLDIWGDDLEYWFYNQVSRRGVSLVLQLNLNGQHNNQLSQCMKAGDRNPFSSWGHPARDGDFPTLSWCRLDIDLEKQEALIEEIQSDLLRDIRHVASVAYKERKNEEIEFRYCGRSFDTQGFIRFWEREFSYHEKTWHEAMLTAALWFLREELGVKSVFYHTYESGAFLKRIRGSQPPKSIYTSVPRKFCFQETCEVPELLTSEKRWKRLYRKKKEFRFYKMHF